MRGLKSTLALVVILAGLGGYIYFVDAKRPAGGADQKEKAFTVEADKLQEIRVTSGGETSLLRKADGTWKLAEPVETDADETEVSSLTSNIASLEVNRVVDENATDLAQYGLATPALEIAFKADGNVSDAIALGDKTPTSGDIYAVRPGNNRVFLVSAYLESTFSKKPFDLRDKRILRFERDQVDNLEVAVGAARIALARDGSEWTVKQPIQSRGDYGAIEGLLTRLSSANMTTLVESAPTDLKKYGLVQPDVVLSIGAGSAKAELAVAKEQNGEVHALDRMRNLVFTIDPTLATDLRKGADDYRDKDLFEFRPYNASSLTIARDADTYEFKKVPGQGENATEKWQRVTAAASTDIEGPKMDELLNKLSALRAQSFSGSTDSTGVQQPALTVSVSYDNGKSERVRIGRSGGEAFAVHGEEPGAARLDKTAFDDAIKALDAAIAPPTTTQTSSSAPPAKP